MYLDAGPNVIGVWLILFNVFPARSPFLWKAIALFISCVTANTLQNPLDIHETAWEGFTEYDTHES